MSLRLILLLLTLLAFISASAGGFFYYSSLQMSFYDDVERDAVLHSTAITNSLSSFLTEQLKPVRTLAGLPEIRNAMSYTDNYFLAQANTMLDHFNSSLGVDVCYLMDNSGNTIASSNRHDADSFVGKNFGFRPYFQEAIRGIPSTYMALGTASAKRGVYFSYPVFGKDSRVPLGVAVIKASVMLIEQELIQTKDEIVLLVDPHGIIFISNQEEWLFKSLWPLPSGTSEIIADTMQFGKGPWEWTGLTPGGANIAVDFDGHEYLMFQQKIENFPGWNVVYLRNAYYNFAQFYKPMLRTLGVLVFPLLLLIIISVLILYNKARSAIAQRKSAEDALRESETRYRTLYHNTPALLHSIDPQGQLVSVSDYWLDMLGYSSADVIGRKVTEFMTDSSRKRAENIVIPDFLFTGMCNDIPYQFVKKNGEIMDVLLSAIAERDNKGNIKRSLAVLLDISEQKRIEEQLKKATENLSRYSKDLERQVKERTLEISNILKYTPAVVYLKDKKGNYLLANTRFEELFAINRSDIRGKTDYDIFPTDIADQLRDNDQLVLTDKQPLQIEENIPHKDGIHIYLSVKFPLYDENKAVNGVGGISTDITALKKVQDQLKRLSSSIIAGQEKERSAIARELHDELGQILTAFRIDSVWLYKHLKKRDKNGADRALAMCNLIDQTIDEVRSMAVRLRPGVLDDLGLIAALEWLTTDFEKRTGILCTFNHNNLPEMGDVAATAIYRITQEALTNAARHSDAGHVNVDLKDDGKNMTLTISDDGKSFDPELLEDSEGLGFAGIRERAGLIGGTVSISGNPGEGTTLILELDIDGITLQ